MENEIKGAISYFSYFSYPPTSQEICTFLKKKTSAGHFTSILEKMVKKGAVKIYNTKHKKQNIKHEIILIGQNRETGVKFNPQTTLRYTLGEYGIPPSPRLNRGFGGTSKIKNRKLRITSYELRERISKKKIKKIDHYVNLLSIFPQIKLIGLSGSVAMLNANEDHDVDLFIITDKNRLWTGRLISLLLVSILGLRRKRNRFKAKDKVCLNLFIDEARMNVPKYKRTEYVAHEILQMRPLVNKNSVYEAFLEQNKWVYKIFPNAHIVMPNLIRHLNKKQILNRVQDDKGAIGNILEFLLKKLQLNIIKLHQTTEIVTDTQLWFHPEDFAAKLHNLNNGRKS